MIRVEDKMRKRQQSWSLRCLQDSLCVSAQSLSHTRLFAILWTVARQAPLPMEVSRQEYQSRMSFPPSGDLSDPGIGPLSLASSALAGEFFTTSWEASWEAHCKPAQNSDCDKNLLSVDTETHLAE